VTPDPYPYERRPDENEKQWAAFLLYRDSGPEQSLRSVAREMGLNPTTVANWSVRHSWVERSRAWSVEVDRRRREEFVRETVEMSRRQAAEAAAYSRALTLPVQILLDRIGSNPEEMRWLRGMPIENLYGVVVACARTWPTVVNLERLVRGAASHGDPVVPQGEPQATMTDNDRMKQVLAILEEAGAVAAPELAAGNGQVVDVP
jgi:hypothetical protein